MIPPAGVQIIEYPARPTARFGGSETSAAAKAMSTACPRRRVIELLMLPPLDPEALELTVAA